MTTFRLEALCLQVFVKKKQNYISLLLRCISGAFGRLHISQSQNVLVPGGGIEGNHSDRQGHGGPLGAPVRHDHHQQRHAARLHAAVERDQQPGARAAVGARALAQAHLAPVEPRCFRSIPRPDISRSDQASSHCVRVRYAQTNIPRRGSNANGFTFVRLPPKTLDFEKIQVRT